MSQTGQLRVVAATPISEDLIERVVALEPRIEFVRRQDLLPPMRVPADHGGDPAFRRTPEQQAEFDALVDSADVLYGIPDSSPQALARTVAANPRLRWVQTMAAGGGGQVKSAGLTSEQLERVAFSTSAGVHADPLAEFAVFGVLAGAKTLPRLIEQQARREWSLRWTMSQISEQTALIVGLGSIGRATAVKLAALGMRVVGTSRRDESFEGVDEVVRIEDLPRVIGDADAVIVTLPGTEATEGLLDRDLFAAMKPGTTIVNVGRGTVIDETALIHALDNGQVGFAALDVFAHEPLAADSPLWKSSRVLVSPHTAALDVGEDRSIAELFARNAHRFLDGKPLLNRVNTVEFY